MLIKIKGCEEFNVRIKKKSKEDLWIYQITKWLILLKVMRYSKISLRMAYLIKLLETRA
jgi:hypothetical protein